MKTLIAASLILASGITQAQSFDYEKAVGSSELFSTLATDQAVTVNVGNSNGFAYQEAVGSHDLFPTLIGNSERPHDATEGSAFAFQESVGQELDPSLS